VAVGDSLTWERKGKEGLGARDTGGKGRRDKVFQISLNRRIVTNIITS
jgi:hypothetical protein